MMKHYSEPLLKISRFDVSVATTDSAVINYTYATQAINEIGFRDYLMDRITSTEFNNVIQYK